MNRKMTVALIAGALLAGFALTVFADGKPELLVKQRRAGMVLIGKYFGPLAAMAQDKIPYNAETVARNAAYLDVLAKMPWDGFQETTINEKSEALPAVYKDNAKFKHAADDMQQAITTLAETSKGKNPAAVKSAIDSVGKICSWCHDKFREKKD